RRRSRRPASPGTRGRRRPAGSQYRAGRRRRGDRCGPSSCASTNTVPQPTPSGRGEYQASTGTMSANDNDHRGLLPAGLADLLPPDAAREARAIDIAIERFALCACQRVKPPLVEFEESLLGGPAAALGPQTFRLMDPVSQRMMGVRPDMT